MLNPDASRGVRLALTLAHVLVPVPRVLLELAVRRGHHPPAGPRTSTLAAGIRGHQGEGHLGPGFPVGRAEVTDPLERRPHESDLAFGLRPFQILTRSLRPE